MGNSVKTIRAVIPIFSTIYPVIFKLLYVLSACGAIYLTYRAMTRPSEQIYTNFMSARERIIGFVINPSAQPQNVGIKATAWKFVQKVLIAGTRGASADPRVCRRGGLHTGREDVLTIQLQVKGKTVDANINMITAGSPLSFNQLDEEANMLRTQLVTQLYSAE